MPDSFPVFDDVVRQLIALVAPSRALDVGTGAGKYGRMLAEHVPGCQRVGIEIEASHVLRFGLDRLYDTLHVDDASRWWRRSPNETFDLVLIGDCIGQMPKSEGQDLLNALVYRCAWLVVLAPEFVVSSGADGTAAHHPVSIWSERDLHWHDLWAWDNCRATTLMVLRGYQPSALNLDQLVAQLNAADLPVRHFDGQGPVRPGRLRQVGHRREVDYRLA